MSIATQPLRPLTMPLDGVRLIEASAGTGKTWTIAALYVRAVLGHGLSQPLLPPQLLVVTFTEAATQELRDRIRARLVDAAHAFRTGTSSDPFLQELIDDYAPATHPTCARQLDQAAQWMDEAAIFTIHGWSQRMLTQHAFGSGHAFAVTLEPDESELLADCVRDYWRQAFYPLPPRQAEAIARQWRGPDALLRDLKPLFYSGEVTLRVDGAVLDLSTDLSSVLKAREGWQQRHDERMQAAASAWLADVERIEAVLMQAASDKSLNNTSYKPERMPAYLATVRTWAAGGEATPDELKRFAASTLAARTSKGKSRPEHPAFAALDLALATLEDEVDIRHAVLADALVRVRQRFLAQKRRRAQIGFDDLLTRLDAALGTPGGPALAEAIRRQYPLALIDEFQDTDPVQYRIFDRIYGGVEGAGLLLIGDPKQAIYAFRGADIHTYLTARSRATPPHFSLDTNYRSTQAMVEAVNALFSHGEDHPHGAFRFPDRGLPFVPVQARGREERFVLQHEAQPALTVWLLDDDAPVGVRHYREQMADACASHIVQLLEGALDGHTGFEGADGIVQPLKPADIAVLVRSHAEAAQVRFALASRRVRSVFLSDRDSVLDSTEALDVLAWLRAVASPTSDTAMRAALATRTLDLGYAELERLNVDERHWEWRGEQFMALRRVWQHGGVLAMLHALLHAFDLPARLLAREQGERALTNVLHLAELLQHAAATIEGEHALIRYLGERIADTATHQGDDQLVRLESDDDVVKVITIHKSKGLEYPIVFLPFVCASGGPQPGQATYRYHDGQGPQLELVARSKGGAASEQAKEAAELAHLQEDLRLLYVAMTRARHACYLGVAPVCHNTSKTPQVHRSAFGHLLGGGQDIGNGSIAGLLNALAARSPAIRVDYMPAPDDRRYEAPAAVALPGQARVPTMPPAEPWRIASYSGLRYAEQAVAPDTPSDDVILEYATEPSTPAPVVQGIHAFHKGAEAGTFLHDLLEWMAEEGFAAIAADPERLRDMVARRCERRGWTAFIDLLASWLGVLLRTPMAMPAGGPLALASLDDPSRYRAELEFLFESRRVDTLALDRIVRRHTLGDAPRPHLTADTLHGMLKGFIDLIVEHEGRWYVLDYKSNWLGPDASAYTPDAMRESILHSRYELQYALYLLALHRQLRARLGAAYDYDTHVGGAVYMYLRGIDGRGHGVHAERPPKAMVEALDALFEGRAA